VKAVTQFNVIFHDGSSTPKKLCAKVEIVSLLDCPRDVDCPDDFYKSIGCTKYNQILEREVADLGGYKKMRMAQFDELDLLTHL
jgi:hypothetical protein